MSDMKTAVFGIYHTEKQAERSVDDLMVAGFLSDDISVLLPDHEGTRAFAHEKNTKAPEGTAAGVTAAEAADADPVPAELIAATVKVYAVPLVRPVTTMGEPAPVAVIPPGLAVAM